MREIRIICMLIVCAAASAEALGCVCVGEPNITPEKIRADRAKAFEEAATVFSGEVVMLDRFTVRFRVEKIWKGPLAEEISMLTGAKDNGDGTLNISSCDYGFTKGERYLVYAYGPPGELKTHVCSRTTQMKYAANEEQGLDEISPHRTVAKEPNNDESLSVRRNLTSVCADSPSTYCLGP